MKDTQFEAALSGSEIDEDEVPEQDLIANYPGIEIIESGEDGRE